MRIHLFIFIFLVCSACSTPTDYKKQIQQLEAAHQACLDKGDHMMQCSRAYSIQMDSMLNIVYKDLITRLPKEDKIQLQSDERIWIRNKNEQIKKIYQSISTSGGIIPQDDRMMAYEEEAAITQKRIMELLELFNKTK